MAVGAGKPELQVLGMLARIEAVVLGGLSSGSQFVACLAVVAVGRFEAASPDNGSTAGKGVSAAVTPDVGAALVRVECRTARLRIEVCREPYPCHSVDAGRVIVKNRAAAGIQMAGRAGDAGECGVLGM